MPVAFGRDPHVKTDQDCILVNFFKDSLYKEQLGSMDCAHDEIMTKRIYTKEMRHTITGMICTLQGTNISHHVNRKIIFKIVPTQGCDDLGGFMPFYRWQTVKIFLQELLNEDSKDHPKKEL